MQWIEIIYGVAFLFLKVTQWKKHLCIFLNICTLKFEFFLTRTESHAFVLVFVRKKNEFLTAKHWLRLRRTVLKKVNTE